MELKPVDKSQYRARLKKVIVAFIAIFAGSSLIFGQILITVFSEPNADNFSFNLLGVIFGLMLSSGLLAKFKHHEFMTEVYYVWQLKQVMNRIYRSLAKVKAQAEKNNVDALIVLNYYYELCQKIYKLDDNTITLSSLVEDHSKVLEQISSLNLSISIEDYRDDMLNELIS